MQRTDADAPTSLGPGELPAVGTLLMDTARDVVGEFQGVAGGRFHLRPVGGGREWAVTPDYIREPTQGERLAAGVAAANARAQQRRAG